jgi:hypothetical protein
MYETLYFQFILLTIFQVAPEESSHSESKLTELADVAAPDSHRDAEDKDTSVSSESKQDPSKVNPNRKSRFIVKTVSNEVACSFINIVN